MSLEALREHYLDQPHEVSLETYARCNAACTFCPYPTLDRIGTKLDDNLLWRLVDEMSEWKLPFDFCPFKVNEPLLDKYRLMPLLEAMEERTLADIRLFTNGSALTFEWAERLNQLDRLKVLWVSLNSHDPAAYKDLMGLDFKHVSGNLDMLHESDFRHPVVVSRVGADQAFVEYCHKRWPEFECVLIKKDGWLGYTDPDIDQVPDTPCSRWFEMSIMSNGRVALCCMDGKGEFEIGDLNKQTLLDVYNTPNWRNRRLQMISRKEVYPCSTCTY